MKREVITVSLPAEVAKQLREQGEDVDEFSNKAIMAYLNNRHSESRSDLITALDKAVSSLESIGPQQAATAELALVSGITKAAEHDWHAAAWHLERRYPDRWGRK